MRFIRHRVNTLAELDQVDPSWGVEIDLRSNVQVEGSLHLSHDPWSQGESFETWLQKYQKLGISGPLILNTKEDGLESRVLQLLNQHEITNFFFLDTAIPTLVKWIDQNKSFFAVRYSSYEPPEFCLKFAGKARWLWVDCFKVQPLKAETVLKLAKEGGFQICLVSPELQGGSLDAYSTFQPLFSIADAICTKNVYAWKNLEVGEKENSIQKRNLFT